MISGFRQVGKSPNEAEMPNIATISSIESIPRVEIFQIVTTTILRYFSL